MKQRPSAVRITAASLLLAAFFSAVPISSVHAAEPQPVAAEVLPGAKAPDFTLTDIDGKQVKLSDFSKKIVVLEWFNDGCPFVKKHYNSGNMQALQKEYKKKGVVWLSIDSSGPGQQGNHNNDEFKKILKDWNAEPAHLLVDADGKVGHMYGAKTTPTMFVLGKGGTVLYHGAIDDKPDTNPESVKGAKNYVQEALDAALTGKEIATNSTRSYGCRVHYGG